jgi:lysophospholipase L1-like esterase
MKTKRLFIIGDSTAQYNNATTYPQTGWGQTLGLFLNDDVAVFNYAKNGQSSKSFFDLGLFAPVVRRLRSGDILLIQFGHNDQKDDVVRKTDPFTSYRHYLSIYVDMARSKGAFPILLTSITRRHFGTDGHLKKKTHFEFPLAVKELSIEKSVPLIDMYELTWNLIENMGDARSRQWFMHLEPGDYPNYPEGLNDDTHFVHAGAVAMSKLISERMKDLGSPYDVFVLKTI